MTEHYCAQHLVFAQQLSFRFNHQYSGFSTGNNQIQFALFQLVLSRVQYVLVIDVTYAGSTNRAIERNTRQRQRCGSTNHRDDIRVNLRVNRNHGGDNLNFVDEAFREQRTNRTVYHTRGQNRLFRGLSFPLGERTGNLSHRIHPFLIVHRQREKVDALSRLCACSDIRHHHGIAVAYPAGTVRQSAGLSGLDRKGSAGKGCFKSLCVLKHILSFLS